MWDWAYLVPLAGISIPIIVIWTKHQQKLAEMRIDSTADATAEKAAQYASQVQRLEDRVQVLERIVTDRGYDVATQIEALRDTRSVEDGGSGVPLNVSSKEKA
ncbi:hypothetical protein INR77_14185 [Erythrobacter sp. SCSIO 43205]|uniref:hypothetical protein n=1 Tax=Erythrobacter sp. SCSIO 43205 TaxID=2779361 RepID=UPI001CA80DB4|nr:hypothetical protein [Erythrobacter sp. SCSIO 43205]UAB77906.1 hypothetical protein INR77_14185 [Erythrobacter sp. SCSIO 43205]